MPCNLPVFENPVSRRNSIVMLLASALPVVSTAAVEVTALLRAGGCVVLLRHTQTVPGVGDPPGFNLNVCATQRNLDQTGRQDAFRIGAWFRSHKLVPRAIMTSAWCRSKDTADMAFSQGVVWPALNSTFGDQVIQPDQTALLKRTLLKIPKNQFEVWVTHQVNISAISGQAVAPGEGIILDSQGKVLARTTFA